MRPDAIVERASLGWQLIGFVTFFAGIGLLFAFPVGTVLAPLVMWWSMRVGRKKEHDAWRCERCQYAFRVE
jgi:uncharacterized Tic20 family protein